MRIAVDIDDTITKTFENNVYIMQKYNYVQKSRKDFTPEEFEQFLKIHNKEIHELMEPKDNVSEVLHRLHEDNEIVIITSRDEVEFKETIKFMEKYDIPYDELYIDIKSKGSFAKSMEIDLIIDDSEYHLDECHSHGIKCIKFSDHSEKYKYFDDWLELEKYIKELTNGKNNRCEEKGRGKLRR